jgi:hypothetical protein
MMRDETSRSAETGWIEQNTFANLKRLKLPSPFQPETGREMVMASQFLNGEFLGKISRCRYGRLHSPLTRTERRIRPLLRLDGKPDSLVEIDISCCQPLLLGIMAGDQKMVETCGTRGSYTEVEDCLKQPRMKAIAKKCFMWWMFRQRDTESKQYVDAISSLMASRYPKVFRTWSMYAGDHLAQLLQKRESMIMIDGALTSLVNSGVFAVSVHDSFLVRKEDTELVKQTIAASFPPIDFSITTATGDNKKRQLIRGTQTRFAA